MGQKVADDLRRHAGMRSAVLSGRVIEEPANPVGIRALGPVGVVTSSQTGPELLERPKRIGPSLFVDHRARRAAVPLGTAEEIDEVEAERLVGLTDLPILEASLTFEALSELTHPIDERLIGRRS